MQNLSYLLFARKSIGSSRSICREKDERSSEQKVPAGLTIFYRNFVNGKMNCLRLNH